MKIEIEDTISGIMVLIFLVIWYLTLVFFDSPLMSLGFLWISMTLLSIIYVYIYKKRKRDVKVLRIRFFVTAIPLYPVLSYYVYKLVVEQNLPRGQLFLPLGIIFTVLILNALVIFQYEIKKKTK
jgi:hypothetical protein